MSPIITLQRQLREIGRIRIGQTITTGGKRRPAKLDTFRITSPSRDIVEAAAGAYGGTVAPWEDQWEVVTTTAALDIAVPPGQPVSQWYELWGGGGCLRRCDGVTNVLTDGPCECPQDTEERIALAANGQACKATTRLKVILPSLPDFGVFRLESHGYYAATELAGAAEVLAMATARGYLIEARLRLDQREKKVPGKATQKYAVPVIEFVGTTMADLGLTAGSRLVIAAPDRPALPATTLPPSSDMRAPASLSQAEFLAGLEANGIDRDYAVNAVGRVFPNHEGGLTGEQRADLLEVLLDEKRS